MERKQNNFRQLDQTMSEMEDTVKELQQLAHNWRLTAYRLAGMLSTHESNAGVQPEEIVQKAYKEITGV